MDPHASTTSSTVSNLVPSWDDAMDGGGSFEPAEAATVVEQAVHPERPAREVRLVTPPERFDAAEPVRPSSAFAYDLLREDEDTTWAERTRVAAPVGAASDAGHLDEDDEGLPVVDYDLLARRDIAKELLRARLVAIAEQREHRSAYEIVFIMLAAAVSILLAAPPLVQVLLAAHGTQA